jgi:hypothetical protein
LSFSPNGKILAVASSLTGKIELLDVTDGKYSAEPIETPRGQLIFSVACGEETGGDAMKSASPFNGPLRDSTWI